MVTIKLGVLALLALCAAANKKVFTAEDMLSSPRPSGAIASPDGLHGLSVVDQWDPKADNTTRSVYLLSLGHTSSSPTQLFSSTTAEASSFFWLSNTILAYLNGTDLLSFDIAHTPDQSGKGGNTTHLLTFPDGVNPAEVTYQRDVGALVFAGQVWGDGSFELTGKNDQAFKDRGYSGVVYDELWIRHWDTWRTPGKVWTLGFVQLDLDAGYQATILKGHSSPFVNLLNGTDVISQMDPFSSITISKTHVAFTVKSPHKSYALHTREDVYAIPLPLDEGVVTGEVQDLSPNEHGAIGGVTFSPDGKRIAWLEEREDGYESDKRAIVVNTLSKHGVENTERWVKNWDRSPSSITWSLDSQSLYLIAEHQGSILPYHVTHPDRLPTPLYFKHSTSSITPLSDTKLLLTISSFTSPSDNFILDLSPASAIDDGGEPDKLPNRTVTAITSWSKKTIAGRLDDIEIEDLWFKGAAEWDVMAWVLKPSGSNNLQRGKDGKLPLAFFVHGGPQGSWEDSWSTRWNPALFAANGYFVVAVNPTGSTGYGQEFTDKIKGDWGGAPFQDLLAGFQAALDKYPEIDRERTAMLGASYGGYMANWIQGHNDQFRFKAIVCHDGIFDTTTAFYETEEVYFPNREFGGSPTQNRALYEKWNPMNHVSEWKTPELVIHSGLDFRLADSQGIAAFTALQVQGVPSRFLYFPDENHWVLQPRNSRKWHYEVFRWLGEWTGKKSDEESSGEWESTGQLPL